MLLQSSQTKAYVSAKPTDMRKSFHGLQLAVQDFIKPGEIYEALFLFVNRKKDRVKILHYDCNGFALWYKLLDAGTYQVSANEGKSNYLISLDELNKILTEIKLSRRHESSNKKPTLVN